MARFCTEKYPERPNHGNFSNLYAHLTNYSLNKMNNAYVHSKSLKEQLKGGTGDWELAGGMNDFNSIEN